ncbi:hypothetical protein FIU86_09325 [Roseovarius sp. THAF9]|uniref:hypothetical protein n=1 Tax=Roseovarius sp. THAF9 TaxID=2587847 RepID=UPI0012694BC7|nr:hypothetical protein [Roseovarius sp. THAF9]QFT93045.1 hypothetical protein FIU86_09325 [Roseovarius sp. THAF9]
MNPRWLFRMSRWAQNPPSAGRVKFVFAIIGICLLIFGIEYFFGLPDWMAVDPKSGRYRP